MPFLSSGGIVEVELGEMNVFKTVQHFLDNRVSDFNLLEGGVYVFLNYGSLK